MTIAPVEPRPLAKAMQTTVDTSMAAISASPASARPPARRATPGGNRKTGRTRRCSRHAGTAPTTTRAAMPSVVPTDRTSSAVSGGLDSGRPWLSGTKARQVPMTTRLEMAGPRVGPANRRYACSSPYRTTESPYSRTCGANTASNEQLQVGAGQLVREPAGRLTRLLRPVPLEDPERPRQRQRIQPEPGERDRKSTRLNSSHGYISYAVFCLNKK